MLSRMPVVPLLEIPSPQQSVPDTRQSSWRRLARGLTSRLVRPVKTPRRRSHPVAEKWTCRLPPLSVREPSKEERAFADFEGWGLTDIYVLRLCAAAGFEGCRAINFSQNRLEGPSLATLFTQLPETLQSMNLSKNRLTCCPIEGVKFPHLTELNLNDNPLGDYSTQIFDKLVVSFPALRGLSMSNCRLGSENAARSFARYIGRVRTLTNLDLHWNSFSSSSGVLLFGGLLDNAMIPGGLRRVHLTQLHG